MLAKDQGRKRHIVTDMTGNMLEGIVHAADVQDRDGALDLINRTCDNYPAVKKLFADGGYAGEKLTTAVAHIEALAIEIVKRSDQVRGFVVLPKRWIVERTFAGSIAAAVWQKTGRPQLHPQRHGCSSRQSGE